MARDADGQRHEVHLIDVPAHGRDYGYSNAPMRMPLRSWRVSNARLDDEESSP